MSENSVVYLPNTSLTNGSYFEVLGVHPENVEVTIRDYEQHGYIWYENNYEGELVNITFIRK